MLIVIKNNYLEVFLREASAGFLYLFLGLVLLLSRPVLAESNTDSNNVSDKSRLQVLVTELQVQAIIHSMPCLKELIQPRVVLHVFGMSTLSVYLYLIDID